jgi:hypothetical protein
MGYGVGVRRFGIVALSLVLLACPRRESAGDDPEVVEENSARVEQKREGAAIVKMIQESQRQGLVGQDLEAFMRIWSEDARLVQGRGAEHGPYDEVIPIARVEGYWKRRGIETHADTDVHFKREKHKVKGDRAKVTWDTTIEEKHKETRVVVVPVGHG